MGGITIQTAIEKAGTEAALDRCRALARRIQADLRHKKPEHFVNVMSLADFQVSLERAASVLECEHRRFEANPSESATKVLDVAQRGCRTLFRKAMFLAGDAVHQQCVGHEQRHWSAGNSGAVLSDAGARVFCSLTTSSAGRSAHGTSE